MKIIESMAAVKLTYLNFRGRAELIRYILAQAAVEFEDNRIEPQNWAESVPGVKFGTPVLEYDGEKIQSNRKIAIFLAEKLKCNGQTDEEKTAVAEVFEATEVTWDKMSTFFWEKDEAKKAEYLKELTENHLPTTLKTFEGRARQNGAWIVGQNMTYADLAIAVLHDGLCAYKQELLTPFTALAKLKKSVEELPNVASWISKRPDSSH